MIKNQSVYEMLGIPLPQTPIEVVDSNHEIYEIDGMAVHMNKQGVREYRNPGSRGDAFRKAIFLGINASLLPPAQTPEEQGYASILYRTDRAFTVYRGIDREIDRDDALARMYGQSAIYLCKTSARSAVPPADEQSWNISEFDLSSTPQ